LLSDYKILVHFGGIGFSKRFQRGPDFIIPDPDSQRLAVAGFGFDIANAGDMNGDGDDDILIGTDTSSPGDGFVFVFSGGKALDAAFDAAVGQRVDSRFGTSVSGLGDVNGDGLSDIIVGAPDWRFTTRQGYWGIFLGDRRIPTSVQVKTKTSMPTSLHLSQNYPNPFNAGTNLQFSIPQSGWAQIQIFDITGKQVRVLVDAHHKIGDYTITWDGRDDQGQFCASGVYFSKLSLSSEKGGESQSITKKLVLTR
ncbi:MAG: T9SS type A sorting domain-containing protein, partial [bacterium]